MSPESPWTNSRRAILDRRGPRDGHLDEGAPALARPQVASNERRPIAAQRPGPRGRSQAQPEARGRSSRSCGPTRDEGSPASSWADARRSPRSTARGRSVADGAHERHRRSCRRVGSLPMEARRRTGCQLECRASRSQASAVARRTACRSARRRERPSGCLVRGRASPSPGCDCDALRSIPAASTTRVLDDGRRARRPVSL